MLLTVTAEANRLDRILELAWEAARAKHNVDNAPENKQMLRSFQAEIDSAKGTS